MHWKVKYADFSNQKKSNVSFPVCRRLSISFVVELKHFSRAGNLTVNQDSVVAHDPDTPDTRPLFPQRNLETFLLEKYYFLNEM